MPLNSFGNYLAVVTLPGKDGAEELSSSAFFYLPFLRIFGGLLGIGMVGVLLVRPWRHKLTRGFWLTVPPVIGFLAYLFLPDMGRWDFLRTFWLQQVCYLSITLALICRFQKRRRLISSLLIFLVNFLGTVIVCGILENISYITYSLQYFIHDSLALSIPVLVAVFVSLRGLTRTRLALSLLVSWLLVSTASALYASSQAMPLTMEHILPLSVHVLPYLVVFFVLAGFNRDCATGIKRAFGIQEAN